MLFVFFLGYVPFLFGQETMTLPEAIETGLRNNYGINIARNNALISTHNASLGNAGFLPVIDATGSWDWNLSNAKVSVVSGSELDVSNAHSNVLESGVNLQWRLFDGLNMFITYDKLKALQEKGELQTKIEVEQTLAAIIIAFYNIVRQDQAVRFLTEQVDISRFRLELARLRYETGSGSELEWLKARVEMNADLADLTSQRNEYENSKTYLNELLARNIDTKFEIHDSIPLSDTLRLDSIRALMNIGNTRLKVSEEDIRIARQEMRSSRAQQIPFIDFIAGYNYFRNETEAGFIKYNRYFGPGVGISAGVTLFDGLNLQRQVRNARIVCMNSQLEHDRLKLDLDAYLIRIYNDYRNQLDLVGFELENMTLAERNMDLAKESFSVGAISSLDLREIQKNLLEARERYLTTRFRTKVKETELLLISGQLVR